MLEKDQLGAPNEKQEKSSELITRLLNLKFIALKKEWLKMLLVSSTLEDPSKDMDAVVSHTLLLEKTLINLKDLLKTRGIIVTLEGPFNVQEISKQ